MSYFCFSTAHARWPSDCQRPRAIHSDTSFCFHSSGRPCNPRQAGRRARGGLHVVWKKNSPIFSLWPFVAISNLEPERLIRLHIRSVDGFPFAWHVGLPSHPQFSGRWVTKSLGGPKSDFVGRDAGALRFARAVLRFFLPDFFLRACSYKQPSADLGFPLLSLADPLTRAVLDCSDPRPTLRISFFLTRFAPTLRLRSHTMITLAFFVKCFIFLCRKPATTCSETQELRGRAPG